MDTILTISEYAEKVGVPEEALKGKSKKHCFKIPRFVYWFYLYKSDRIRFSSTKIARSFNRGHKDILSGVRQVQNFVDTNDSIIEPYKEFIEPFI